MAERAQQVQALLYDTYRSRSRIVKVLQKIKDLKGRDVSRDSTLMFWINANDHACVIVYQSQQCSIKIELRFTAHAH